MDHRGLDSTLSERGLRPRHRSRGEASEGGNVPLRLKNARMALRAAHRGYVIQTGRIVLQDTGADLLKSDLVRKTCRGER